MSLNLTEDDIAGLIGYAREKFAAERYPFAPALRPIREVLAKLDATPKPELCRRETVYAEPRAATGEQATALRAWAYSTARSVTTLAIKIAQHSADTLTITTADIAGERRMSL